MNRFDPRIVRVNLEVDGAIKTYEGIAINASGSKYANSLQNECQIQLFNLDKQTQDYILTQTSPFTLNRTPKTVTLEAGRESYGTTKVYVGNVVSSYLSQPPDIAITLRCLTGNFQNGNILSRGQPSQISLFQVSRQLAQDLNTTLTFQATNRNLSNFLYSGSLSGVVEKLAFTGGVSVFIDNNSLVVKDINKPISNTLSIISQETGMIGIPEITELGVRVRFLVNNTAKLGGALQVISVKNPAANGIYVIYKLLFEISNRDTPFYYIAEAARQL